jgi:hypothetical protein
MKGRYGDFWQKNIAGKSTDEMLEELSFSGFNGIYLDSLGYEKGEKEVIESLSARLNTTPLKSENSRLYFFDMTFFNDHLKSLFTPEEFAKKKANALYPLYYEFGDGFSVADFGVMLCNSNGTLILTNYSGKDKAITLSTKFQTSYAEMSDLTLEGSLFNDTIQINDKGTFYVKDLIVPPGRYVIELSCETQGTYVEGQYMATMFTMLNFNITEND